MRAVRKDFQGTRTDGTACRPSRFLPPGQIFESHVPSVQQSEVGIAGAGLAKSLLSPALFSTPPSLRFGAASVEEREKLKNCGGFSPSPPGRRGLGRGGSLLIHCDNQTRTICR